uniref:Uncharacterized protein n=1 Tax=Arion vulgaris TaxID=1028688 RepID=A0A0B6YB69_9EUPU
MAYMLLSTETARLDKTLYNGGASLTTVQHNTSQDASQLFSWLVSDDDTGCLHTLILNSIKCNFTHIN